MFAAESHVTWNRYWAAVERRKFFSQWQGRALVKHIPQDAVMACRCMADVGRLLAIKFMHEAAPGDVITADLASRDSFVLPDASNWLTQ